MADQSAEKNSPPKTQRDRSPAYPFISLKAAIARLVAFEKYFGRHAAPMDKVGLAWDMKGKSSQAAQTLATLKYFGLVEYGGEKDNKTASISADGRNYLRAQQESVKQEILKRSAFKPRQISAYWTKWGRDRPPDPVCLDELVLKGGYTQSAAETFLSVYDDTIAFANLVNSDKLESNGEDTQLPLNGSGGSGENNKVKVGDFVQCEIGGVQQFAQPQKIEWVSDDGKFVRIEGSATGLPIEGITVQEAKAPPVKQPPMTPASDGMVHVPVGFSQDVMSLGTEGKVILQWPEKLSQEAFNEVKDWLDLQVKKIARLSGVTLTPKQPDKPDK